MIAAMMTAANLGSRVTGWGFVVFTIGSLGWITIALGTGQNNLLWTNGFLTLVNFVGIYRWLGRQVRYDDSSRAATARSAVAQVPTLFSVGSLAGAPLIGGDGKVIGTVVEAMMRCSGATLAYIVISAGGVAGVGETLHAISPDEVTISTKGVRCNLDGDALARRAVLKTGEWPASI